MYGFYILHTLTVDFLSAISVHWKTNKHTIITAGVNCKQRGGENKSRRRQTHIPTALWIKKRGTDRGEGTKG